MPEYTAITTTPRVRTCFVQAVADGDGVFTTALSTSDGCVFEIQGAGPPDGLLGVKFHFEVAPPAGCIVQCRYDFQLPAGEA